MWLKFSLIGLFMPHFSWVLRDQPYTHVPKSSRYLVLREAPCCNLWGFGVPQVWHVICCTNARVDIPE